MNSDLLLKATQLARKCHEGQVDKGGKPYIEHCLRVMNQGNTIEEKIVGVLHDAVEDSNLTLEDLEKEGFPEDIISAIDSMSRREDESRNKYLKRVAENPIALAVKIADMTDNARLDRIPNPTEKDIRRTNMYKKDIERLQKKLATRNKN